MAITQKNAAILVRLRLEDREGLQALAAKEERSMAQQIRFLIQQATEEKAT